MSDTQTHSRQPLPSTDTYTNGKPRQVAIFARALNSAARAAKGHSEFNYYSRVDANVVNDFILRMRVSPNDIRIAVDMDKRGWLMWSHLLTIQQFISWQLEVAMAAYGTKILDSIITTEDRTGEVLKEVLKNHPVRMSATADIKNVSLKYSHAEEAPAKAEAQRLMSLPTVSELIREVSEYGGRLVAVIDRDNWKACLIKYPEPDGSYAYDAYIAEHGGDWEHIYNGEADPGGDAESRIEELIFLVSAHTILNTDD